MGGSFGELRALARGVVRHFTARLFLAAWEGREAGRRCFRLVVTFVIATLLFLISYLLLLSFLILSLARLAGEAWEWLLLVLAVVHGMGAVACVSIFTRCKHKPIFTATLAEVKEDLKTLRLFTK
ncbi:phage holin family protein [Candidatus Xiphinematobacter sp. Idaho Grape]|uniref:phage holin family protein n=1 Tax=Candidatus Xiphinematobacter sp. Idaho Grape TaxID=1704307 RepID=UPI0007839EEA|nr:phage holin family protein [Candidatus Xiphinematobacter sp. Idaho Grape]